MSLLHHIRLCNAFDPARFVPLRMGEARIDLVRRDRLPPLRRFPAVFAVGADEVQLVARGDAEALTAAVDEVVETLVGDGVIPKWRNEFFDVAPRWGAKPLFRLDRGALGFFGVRVMT